MNLLGDRLRQRAAELVTDRAEAEAVAASAPLRAETFRELASRARLRAGFLSGEAAAAIRDFAREIDEGALEASHATVRAQTARALFTEEIEWLERCALELDAEELNGPFVPPQLVVLPDDEIEPSVGDVAEAEARAAG